MIWSKFLLDHIIYYQGGFIVIVYNYKTGALDIDTDCYFKRENSNKTKHHKKLNINNPLIRNIIKNNIREYKNTKVIMVKLEWYYWRNFNTLLEFENNILSKWNKGIRDLNKLIT